ncbi:MAG TPA: hypothetical protein VME24_01065 [Alphaproteobacteria bacterium]|nr:hypothetical protein [Alphaproteobacteria bacterium]
MTTLSKIFFRSCNKPGGIEAAAIVGGYWISQMLASYFVSSAVMGTASKAAGAVFFGQFAVLFVLRLIGPLSRTAAILGLCSFGAFTATMAYLSGPWFAENIPSVELMILISTVLALLGVTVDALYSDGLQSQ